MSKSKKNIKISFLGKNSEEVTGSMILIETPNKKILLEAGLYQSNNIKTDYMVNSRKLNFKPKEIDYIFIGHPHIDHIGLLPRLFAEGCNAKVIAVKNTNKISKVLLEDSAFIMSRDVDYLSRKSDITYKPIYENKDVGKTHENMIEFDYGEIYTLDDEISFEFVPSGHIICAAQTVIYIKEGNHTHKILYTSDLGNIQLDKPFVKKFKPVHKSTIVIGESTYGLDSKTVNKKKRDKDIEKIKTVIETTCIERKARVLIPCFSLDRTQMMLKMIYDLFSKDESFNIPIIIDSPLSNKITDVYKNILEGEDKDLIDEITNWKNVRFISDAQDSKSCVADKSPKVIISASGMMTAGRSRHYVKSILPNTNDTILFCGFSTEGSLAGKIKNAKNQKTITIDKKVYKNKCGITCLNSFSSHMQREDLINYYKSINSTAIYLVHGDIDGKISLKRDLEEELRKMGKTTKVVCVNKSTRVSL